MKMSARERLGRGCERDGRVPISPSLFVCCSKFERICSGAFYHHIWRDLREAYLIGAKMSHPNDHQPLAVAEGPEPVLAGSTCRTVCDLPEEFLSMILSCIKNDKQALRTCSLV